METVQCMDKKKKKKNEFAFQTLAHDYSNVKQSESQQHLSLIASISENTTNKKLTPQHLSSQRPDKADQRLWKSPPLWDYL